MAGLDLGEEGSSPGPCLEVSWQLTHHIGEEGPVVTGWAQNETQTCLLVSFQTGIRVSFLLQMRICLYKCQPLQGFLSTSLSQLGDPGMVSGWAMSGLWGVQGPRGGVMLICIA